MPRTHLDQVDSADDVVLVVLERELHGLADRLDGREVDDIVDLMLWRRKVP